MQGTSKEKLKCPPTKMIFHFPNAPQTSKEKLNGVRYCLVSLIKYEQVLTNFEFLDEFGFGYRSKNQT
jgi:hypothetical protein